MASFTYAGQLNGAENPVALDVLVKDSAHVAVGEAVTLNTGVDTATAGTGRIFGICVGLYKDQISLDNVPAADLAGTYVPSTKTYTADSANCTTGDNVKAKVIVDKCALFRNDTDGDLDAAQIGALYHLGAATQVDHDSNALDKGQMWLYKIDDIDVSVGYFCIAESTLDPYVQIT